MKRGITDYYYLFVIDSILYVATTDMMTGLTPQQIIESLLIDLVDDLRNAFDIAYSRMLNVSISLFEYL